MVAILNQKGFHSMTFASFALLIKRLFLFLCHFSIDFCNVCIELFFLTQGFKFEMNLCDLFFMIVLWLWFLIVASGGIHILVWRN